MKKTMLMKRQLSCREEEEEASKFGVDAGSYLYGLRKEDEGKSYVPCGWIGCILQMLPSTDVLSLRIIHGGTVSESVYKGRTRDVYLTATLTPGVLQKRKYKLVKKPMTSVENVKEFKGICLEEIRKLDLRICIKRRQGLFRKPEFLFAWSVPLRENTSFEEKTVWQKVNW